MNCSIQKKLKHKKAIIGDPDFGSTLPQLAGARVEAKQVGRLYGTGALIRKDVLESNLQKQVGDGVRILHLATEECHFPS